MPEYGIAAWCLDPAGADRDALAAAARHGLAALHLAVDTAEGVARLTRPEWQDAITRCCQETGVRISCLALNIVERMPICGMHADEESQRRFQDIVLVALEFAAKAAVPLIYVPSFGLAEITSDDGLYETAALLSRAAESAQPFGIEVASENSLGPADTARFVDLVGQGNFRILFDIYNPLRWGHSPMEIIAVGFDAFATQIHVKDGWLPRYGNAPLGAGDGNVAEIVRELMQRGFDGTFVLENDYGEEHGLDVRCDLETLRMICDS
ncbi:sugar phosphate isomerase/epimerase family protein [Ralstonia nicotianae]|uniref:sugar phosphate isomerase/epimerase family protein n=1 Tax=Ralstonia pseudosolanacearum TaxID=1310165 RepID=UPI002004184E|nr:TIM barrel protein [Ralstonia pseudosolanacearum]MCK4120522.1 TIM barrel protein [Ralstonia pseudosolanacearum]